MKRVGGFERGGITKATDEETLKLWWALWRELCKTDEPQSPAELGKKLKLPSPKIRRALVSMGAHDIPIYGEPRGGNNIEYFGVARKLSDKQLAELIADRMANSASEER